jgi:hypothetical protein
MPSKELVWAGPTGTSIPATCSEPQEMVAFANGLNEKQKNDITRAGLTTWLISLPVMVTLFLLGYQNISGSISILWFPFYIYITLFFFSLTGLIFNRHV